jgi:tRNA(Ile)-lysidine synthase
MTLSARLLRTVRAHQMVTPGGRVLVALSGGADSIAMLHLLRDVESTGTLSVAGVAHFNHQLRPAAADEDERFCRGVAAALALAIEVGRADVRALAAVEGRSIEDAARAARYAFLERAADTLRADAIAVAHSVDDQAETFLLRLLRGAGPRGLAGIRPKVGRVIRPVIEISRRELRGYVAERQLAFREDESNADLSIARNAVRHRLLPILREFSPSVADVLAREAEIARQDEDFLHAAAIDLASSVVLLTKHGIEMDVESVREMHPALASRVVRDALDRAAPGRFFGRDHIRATLALLEGPMNGGGSTLSLPGLTVRREGGRLVLGGFPPEPFSNSFEFPLSIPGEVALPGWTVSAHAEREAGGRTFSATAVSVAMADLKLPLAVRSRKPGDRFRPLGMGGQGRKLQDFLVDRKVARGERDTLPLVVDSDDRIVWVVGQSVAEEFRVTDASQGVILLKAKRLGGEG